MTKLTIGWIGLGDQGAPMARAIAEAGYDLHVWARRPQSLDTLTGLAFIAHETTEQLGTVSDVVGLCLSDDPDVREVMTTGGLLDGMRPGSVLINHGTGLPAFAAEMTVLAAQHRVDVLDAPVSGGNAGAVAKTLTTLVGGDPGVLARVRPILETFSATVARLGGAGAGQTGKLLNNALLMANQKNIADIFDVAGRLGVDIPALIDVVRTASGSSAALQSLGSSITTTNAAHLSKMQLIDMDIFTRAVAGLGDDIVPLYQRAVEGAEALPSLAALANR